jgi:hypothetical protein
MEIKSMPSCVSDSASVPHIALGDDSFASVQDSGNRLPCSTGHDTARFHCQRRRDSGADEMEPATNNYRIW